MSNELAAQKPKTMMIKNLCPGLMEMGKIKIGNKGAVRKTTEGKEWQAPQKLDHFLITTMERGTDGNYVVDRRLHGVFGESPKSIPVRLIYDDIGLNFATRYICYYGKTVFCSGDGDTAQRLQSDKKTYATRTCPCGRQDPKYTGDNGPGGPDAIGGTNDKGKCKINGILSVIIDGAEMVGGVWKFRTTSYNSVVGILSSLALISRITGGRLAGIPLNMTVTPKTVQDPIRGNQQTIYVVGLQFAGTMESLRGTGYQIAMDEAKHGISMQRIEEQARQMITYASTGGLGDDPVDDVIEEFYPEEVVIDGVVHHEPARENAAGQAPARERGKPSPGKQRRTAAEVEEDRLADEADARAAEQTNEPAATEQTTTATVVDAETVDETTGEVTGGEPLPNVDTEDDNWPNPPDGPAPTGPVADLF